MLTRPFRRGPIRFLPSSRIMNDFARLANLAMITSRENAVVSRGTSGIMSRNIGERGE